MKKTLYFIVTVYESDYEVPISNVLAYFIC